MKTKNRMADAIMKMNTTKQSANTDKSVSDLLAEAKQINQKRAGVNKAAPAKTTSPIVDVFLCGADGVVELAKFAMSEAPILKAHGVIVVEADPVSMLTFKLQKQYHGGDVSLDSMLKAESFKAAYNNAK
ncbi:MULTISPECIES: hypothetical protein [Pseudomonas]|uniref:hypothetical protein n=1 Tax=Pseudomonas TaxID=286 RepID=UPI00091D5DC5|nr:MULTISPECIES: hypothetical protein [Pseudomonas]SHI35685.1 hypothetical protein SAMN05216295_101362 [Pseudomonas zeshuii]